jgi:5-formyltetrahydrofolate cyclo-ligase
MKPGRSNLAEKSGEGLAAIKKAKQEYRIIWDNKSKTINPEYIISKSRAVEKKAFRLSEFKKGISFFIYLSKKPGEIPSEIQTYSIIEQLLREGKTVSAPRMIKKDAMEACIIKNLKADIAPGNFGFYEATTSKNPDSIDVCIVPVRAVDSTGARIGSGRGVYDRFFAMPEYNSAFFDEFARPHIKTTIALVLDEMLVKYRDLPQEPTDKKIDLIVSSSMTIDCKYCREHGEPSRLRLLNP